MFNVTDNRPKYLILILILVLILLSAFSLFRYWMNLHIVTDTNNIDENTTPQQLDRYVPNPITGSLYQSNTGNIRFIIPEGWAVHTNTNLALPVGFKDPYFVLQKTGTACTIVEAKVDIDIPDTRKQIKQISFADRIFSNYTQFDGNWWIASTSESTKYLFSNHTRQNIIGEFRVSGNLRNDPFLLFMSDGTAVPNDCNRDFNAMLQTVEPYYETTNLTSSSKGILTTEKVWDDVTPDPSNKSYEHLVFIADGSKEKKEVMRIPTGTWAGGFSVFGRKLYVPSNSYQLNESAIYVLDPFNGQTEQVPGTATTNSYISSLYLRDDVAYYLVSSSALGQCLDGYHPCAADLYSIPITGGIPTLIAHSSLGGSILGYVENEFAFYIIQGWGDAGCSSTFINKIVKGKEEPVGEFSGCYGDGTVEADGVAYKQMRDKVNAIITKASASKLPSKDIYVENGTLQPTTSDMPEYSTFYFDR